MSIEKRLERTEKQLERIENHLGIDQGIEVTEEIRQAVIKEFKDQGFEYKVIRSLEEFKENICNNQSK